MTVPYERTRSVLRTRQFLQELAAAGEGYDMDHFINQARTLLRHYPDPHHLRISAVALPDVWADPDAKWNE